MRGRPRGSGSTAEIPAVPLTPAEAIPFNVGYRLGPAGLQLDGDNAADLAKLSPLLSLDERRSLRDNGAEFFIPWVMIGVMQWHIETCLKHVRHS